MREDLSAETLDVVYDGSKMTFGALLKIFQIASEHHNKSIHTGEQSVKHFYESAQKNEILDEIDPEDWRGIRSMMKNRYQTLHTRKIQKKVHIRSIFAEKTWQRSRLRWRKLSRLLHVLSA